MPVCEICKTKGVLTSYKNLVLHLQRSAHHPGISVSEYRKLYGSNVALIEEGYMIENIKKRDMLIELTPFKHLERFFKNEKEEWKRLGQIAGRYSSTYGKEFKDGNYEGWLLCLVSSRLREVLNLKPLD